MKKSKRKFIIDFDLIKKIKPMKQTQCKRCGKIDAGVHTCSPNDIRNNELIELIKFDFPSLYEMSGEEVLKNTIISLRLRGLLK